MVAVWIYLFYNTRFLQGFHWCFQLVFTGGQSFLNWTSLSEKLSCRWTNQADKIILSAGQFALCPALNETPVSINFVKNNLTRKILLRPIQMTGHLILTLLNWCISFNASSENLVVNQDNITKLMILFILISFLFETYSYAATAGKRCFTTYCTIIS